MEQNSKIQDQMSLERHIEPAETVFSEIMAQPEFANFQEISKILTLMNSLDTNKQPRYRTYVAENTAG